MTRRAIVSLAALLGVVGVLLIPAASQAAPSQPAVSPAVASAPSTPAQVGTPPGLARLGAILQNIFSSFESFMPGAAETLRTVFTNLANSLLGGCSFTFCASP